MDVIAAVMNVITFKAAYCLYPRATFEERTSLLMTNDNSRVTTAVAKYCLRGWTFTRDPIPHKSHYYHIGKMRNINDSMTWKIPLCQEGVQTRAALSSTSPPFTWDPIEPNSWAILQRDGFIMHYNIQRTYSLRYCYTTAITALYECIKEHFDGQNLVELCKVQSVDEVQWNIAYTWFDIAITTSKIHLTLLQQVGWRISQHFIQHAQLYG